MIGESVGPPGVEGCNEAIAAQFASASVLARLLVPSGDEWHKHFSNGSKFAVDARQKEMYQEDAQKLFQRDHH